MSDLDPQQVISRATGHFQPCFPASRPVNRPVFASKTQTNADKDEMEDVVDGEENVEDEEEVVRDDDDQEEEEEDVLDEKEEKEGEEDEDEDGEKVEDEVLEVRHPTGLWARPVMT